MSHCYRPKSDSPTELGETIRSIKDDLRRAQNTLTGNEPIHDIVSEIGRIYISHIVSLINRETIIAAAHDSPLNKGRILRVMRACYEHQKITIAWVKEFYLNRARSEFYTWIHKFVLEMLRLDNRVKELKEYHRMSQEDLIKAGSAQEKESIAKTIAKWEDYIYETKYYIFVYLVNYIEFHFNFINKVKIIEDACAVNLPIIRCLGSESSDY